MERAYDGVIVNLAYTRQCERNDAFCLLASRRNNNPLWLPRDLRQYIVRRYLVDPAVKHYIPRSFDSLAWALKTTHRRVYTIVLDPNVSARERDAMLKITWPVLDIAFIVLVLATGCLVVWLVLVPLNRWVL